MSTSSAEPFASERIGLRPIVAEDAAAMAREANDAAVSRFTSELPFPYTLADAQAFIASLETRRAELKVFAIAGDEGRGALIGVIGIKPGADGVREVGYWLGRAHWGRGIASRAVGELVARLRADGPPHAGPLHAIVAHGNDASMRVLEKAGFVRQEGVVSCATRAVPCGMPATRFILAATGKPSA